MKIHEEKIQEILRKADLVEIIKEDILSLNKESGDEYAGFHSNKHGSESKSSLKVNQSKGLYHCFNCGEGGNASNWLVNNRGMDFLESVYYLAAKTGIELDDMTEKEKKEMKKHFENKKKLQEVYKKATEFYASQLNEELYKLIYEKWGINKEKVEEFKIGFAPSSGHCLKEALINEGYEAVITRAGGKGEELKNKVLRNALGAAVKGDVIEDKVQNRRALTRCIETAIAGLDGPMSGISGAGIKIGIVKKGSHLALALHGKIGIPGLEVDHEIAGLGVHYYGLSDGD